jgi:hypothetical protein
VRVVNDSRSADLVTLISDCCHRIIKPRRATIVTKSRRPRIAACGQDA